MDGTRDQGAPARVIVLGAIADDYTGATDLANTFARAGLAVVQTIGVPRGPFPPGVDAVVVALKIRSVPALEAVPKARAAHRALVAAGARHVLYKICSTFDSTDAGNIGPITDALRADTGAAIVPVTPAFPGTGRTVYRGHLFVGDVLLSESPLRDHPLNPMRDPDLVRVLARQSAAPVGRITRETVRGGAKAISGRLEALAAEGCGAAIVDAIEDADLIPLGEAALALPVSTGASGMGYGLARAVIATGLAEATPAAPLPAIGGPAVVIAGSCSAATRAQLAAAEQTTPVLRLDAAAAIENPEAALADALAFARERMAAGAVVIATSAEPEAVAAVQARFGREAAGTALENLAARIAEHLVAQGLRRLVVAGGETSGAVVDALQVEALRIGPEIAPGVPATLALGAPAGALGLVLKSGNFGTEDFFARALEALP